MKISFFTGAFDNREAASSQSHGEAFGVAQRTNGMYVRAFCNLFDINCIVSRQRYARRISM